MRTTRTGPSESAIASVLFGKTRRRLLAWLFMHPDDAFYVRQLVRITGGSPGSVPVELKLLSSASILQRTSKSKGREVYYQVNRKSPIFEELQAIILKTAAPPPRKWTESRNARPFWVRRRDGFCVLPW